MFDIGWSELVVIGVVALIAIGPKELPGVLRSVGYWMGKVRRMASEFQGQFQEAMREAEMADLKKQADDLNTMAKDLTSDFSKTFDPTEAPKPQTPAAPDATGTPLSEVPTASAGAAPLPPPDISAVPATAEEPVPVAPPVPSTEPAPASASDASESPRRAGGTA
jgi:sec-independent protein translocase protein TatB